MFFKNKISEDDKLAVPRSLTIYNIYMNIESYCFKILCKITAVSIVDVCVFLNFEIKK